MALPFIKWLLDQGLEFDLAHPGARHNEAYFVRMSVNHPAAPFIYNTLHDGKGPFRIAGYDIDFVLGGADDFSELVEKRGSVAELNQSADGGT